jgi:hypothetical protein
MASLDTVKVKVGSIIKDTDEKLSAQDIENFIATALEHLNKVKSREKVLKVTNATPKDLFELPTDWDAEFSQMLAVEYPIDENPPEYLDIPDEVRLIDRDDKTYIQFDSKINKDFRVIYTKRRTAVTDIVDFLVEPFCYLVAHFAAVALAFHYSNTSDPTLTADVVDYKSKAQFYQNLSTTCLEKFEMTALRGEDSFAQKDIDVDFGWGEEKLFHRRKSR